MCPFIFYCARWHLTTTKYVASTLKGQLIKPQQTCDLKLKLHTHTHSHSSTYLLSSRFSLLRPAAKDFKSYFQLPSQSISCDGGNFISEKRMGVPTITSTALIRRTTAATVKRKPFQSSDIRFFFFFSPTLRQVRGGGDISNCSRSGQKVICVKWSAKYDQNSFSLSDFAKE